jgi:hypothetical protein
MSIIRTDLSVQPIRVPVGVHGLVRGHIRACANVLHERLAKPDLVDETTFGEWIVRCPVGAMHLSRTPGHTPPAGPTEPMSWQIEAAGDGVLPWIYQILEGTTVGFPRAAAGVFGESTLETFTWAYADFAYLRSRAVHEWLLTLGRGCHEYRTNRSVGSVEWRCGQALRGPVQLGVGACDPRAAPTLGKHATPGSYGCRPAHRVAPSGALAAPTRAQRRALEPRLGAHRSR